jgi:membrane fusion protein (multidrug efflux system)
MTQTPVSSANVVRLGDSSRRLFDRIDHGLEVWQKGQKLELANWSLGGLGLILPDCPRDGTERLELTLRVPVLDTVFPIPVQARLVHYTPSTGYAGLRFEGLSASSYGALRYVQQRYNAGEPLSLEALHRAGREADDSDLILLQPPQPRSRWRWLRYLGLGMLAAAMLYLLGYALKINVFTLAAEYAAVTTPAFELSATADGRVTLLADLASGQLAKGQAVARIADPRLETEIETLKAEAALQESRLRILRQQEQSLSTVYGSYADIAAALSQQKQADLKAAQAQLTEHQARLRRTQDLHKRGLSSDAALEEARSAVLQTEAAVARARAARAEAETNRSLAAKDVLFTGSRVEGGNLQQVRRNLAYAEAEAQNLQERLRALRNRSAGLTLASPCDCVIGRVLATPDSWVKAGAPLLTLYSQKKHDVLVEARVSQADADRLRIEGAARIVLPEQGAVVDGRVSLVRRTPLSEARTGLADALPPEKARAMAVVLVRVLEPLPASAVGLPVRVEFDLRPQGVMGDVLRWVYP